MIGQNSLNKMIDQFLNMSIYFLPCLKALLLKRCYKSGNGKKN